MHERERRLGRDKKTIQKLGKEMTTRAIEREKV